MHANDHPDQFKFIRGERVLTESEQRAAWDRVLRGKARDAALPKMPLAAMMKRSQEMNRAEAVLRRAAGK